MIILDFPWFFRHLCKSHPCPPGDIEPHAQLRCTHGSATQLAVPVAVGRVPISDGEPVAGPGVIRSHVHRGKQDKTGRNPAGSMGFIWISTIQLVIEQDLSHRKIENPEISGFHAVKLGVGFREMNGNTESIH